jgi:small subunit ribosomal protein S14
MTTSDYTKVLKQIGQKKAKMAQYNKHNVPKKRTFGQVTKKCKRCGLTGAHISKYGLHVCRHCFKEIAKDIGFKKYN